MQRTTKPKKVCFKQVKKSDGRGFDRQEVLWIPGGTDRMAEVFGGSAVHGMRWFFESSIGDIFEVLLAIGSLYIGIPWKESRKDKTIVTPPPGEYVEDLKKWITAKTAKPKTVKKAVTVK